MPSIFRRAVGVVKDQTSIGLVRIRPRDNFADVEVAALKATSHDEIPSSEHHAVAVLLHAGGSPESAVALLRLLSRRVARTRCWVVALKSALLALRAIHQPSPYFRRAAISSVVGGGAAGVTLLGLSLFSDSSHPTNPWDFSAFVRTFGLHIDAVLRHWPYRRAALNPAGMTPAAVLDRIGPSLDLLRRAVGTRPTGPARAHRLVKIALYPVIRDTFAVYRDVVDGLAVLLDEFPNLVPPARQEAFRALKMAGGVFKELDNFYRLCREIGVGRRNEYPTVQTVPGEILSRTESVIKKDNEELAVTKQIKSPSLRLLLAAPPPENKVDVPNLMQFDDDHIENSNEWELALAESVASSDVSYRSSGDNAKPASAMMCVDVSLRYKNPFMDAEEEVEEKRVVATAPPTFLAKEHAGEAVESDMFVEAGGFSPTSAMAVTSPRQRMIREMQLWRRRHEGRIMAANKMCME